jgi:4-hydroxybenzoyl-CoA reductase subunit alpha
VEDVRLPGLLHGLFLRSPHAHARLRRVDASRAALLPGVHAVITGKDTPRRYGVMPAGHDETALALDKVRFAGQEVAAVAAVSEAIAAEALRLFHVEYEPLRAYLDAQQALDAEGEWIHHDRPRNIDKEYHHVFGDPDQGFAEADVIVEDTFFHPRVTHAALEPHGTVALYESGRYTLWTSTQTPRHVQRGVAIALDVPESAIRVIPCAVGGGFGGKSETFPQDIAAALLSRISGRPVRFALSREEVFLLHRGRPESHIRMRLGLRRDGRVSAVECQTIQDGGAFSGYGAATILYSGALLGAIYDIANLRFDGYRILTNKPACGPMRGHGTIGARHAFESLLDRAAAALGIDPAAVRERNLLRPSCRTLNGLRVTSYGYPECLRRVVEASGWARKRGRLPRGRGIGLAGSHYVSGAANAILRGGLPHSTVLLVAERDGSVTLFSGASEIGQGASTAQAIIVSSALSLSADEVRVVSGDTALTPVDLGSYSSRVTFMTGNAALDAARSLASTLIARAAPHLGVPAAELELRDRMIQSRRDPKLSLPFLEAVRLAVREEGAVVAKGVYWPPPESQGDAFRGGGVGPGVSYSYAAQAVEVEVDEETGEVRVIKVWAAHDCGRAINPLAVRGQIEGSVWMGLAQALFEAQHWSPQGLCFNGGLLEYKVPTAVDSPPVEAFIVESGDPEGPFGAKEAGEGSLAAILPALTNAIYDACGIWMCDLPVTPERVLLALEEKRRGKASRVWRVKHPAISPDAVPAR